MGNLHLYVYCSSPCALSTRPMRCRRAALSTGRRRRASSPGYPPPQALLQKPEGCKQNQKEMPINTMVMVVVTHSLL